MNARYQENISRIFKFVLPLFVLLFIQVAANAQTYSQEEQNCFDQTQGQVAWAKGGSKQWDEQNIRRLCKGTTWASRTIDCFQTKIRNDVGWEQAIKECQPSAFPSPGPKTSQSSSPSTAIDLSGTWIMYNSTNGEPFDKPATITQTGSDVTTDNGYGARGTSALVGNQIKTSDGKNGLVSADGNRIDWQDYKVHWVRIDLSGTWKGYYGNGSAAPKPATITQNGISLSIDNGEGSVSRGSMSGNTIKATNWNVTGTLTENGTKISWSNNTTWIKQTPPAKQPVVSDTTNPAKQPVFPDTTNWQIYRPPVNTPDPSGGTANDKTLGSQLVGTWTAYDNIGRAYVNPCRIYYDGSKLMIDNGLGSKSELLVSTGLVKATGWGNNLGTWGGNIIDWTNGTNSERDSAYQIGTTSNLIWVKNNGEKKTGEITTDTKIPDFTGSWIAYSEKNVKEEYIRITQHLYKIKYTELSGRTGIADIIGASVLTTIPLFKDIPIRTATVSADGKKITWENGKYWIKE